MTAARNSLKLPIDVSPQSLHSALSELGDRLAALDEEAGVSQRRDLVDRIGQVFDDWALAERQAMFASPLDESLGTLQRLVSELQCIPHGQQRFDQRLKRLQWALRRYCEMGRTM